MNNDAAIDFPGKKRPMPNHGHLVRWAKQGVLLLNTVMTVRLGHPNSHQKKGWEALTDEIIRIVDQHSRERKPNKGVVFLLWGKPAATKTQTLLSSANKTSSSSPHTIICTSHPSPFWERARQNNPFWEASALVGAMRHWSKWVTSLLIGKLTVICS